jgi:predicted regulator of Ras-like GTPase activity (Roadblock/LC7/MglB family)
MLRFQVGTEVLEVQPRQLVVAGWTGRDRAAIDHHIEELAAIGVPRPSAVPLFYRVAAANLTQDPVIECVGDGSSGEVEPVLFVHGGRSWLTVGSDHTDRKAETYSVALSKQLCAKPVACDAWPLESVRERLDSLRLRAWIEEGGREVLYQDGTLAALQPAPDLLARYLDGRAPADGLVMSSVLPGGTDEDRVSAMAAALLSLGERTAQELTRGELEQVYVKGSNGYVILMQAGTDGVLEAIAGPQAKIGMVLLEMKRASQSIARVL